MYYNKVGRCSFDYTLGTSVARVLYRAMAGTYPSTNPLPAWGSGLGDYSLYVLCPYSTFLHSTLHGTCKLVAWRKGHGDVQCCQVSSMEVDHHVYGNESFIHDISNWYLLNSPGILVSHGSLTELHVLRLRYYIVLISLVTGILSFLPCIPPQLFHAWWSCVNRDRFSVWKSLHLQC